MTTHLPCPPLTVPTEGTTTRIAGGTATLRPLGPGEAEPLEAVFAGMSPESRAERYLTPVPRILPVMLRALTAVDGRDHVAWLASVEGRPAGIARYVRVGAGTAEIAFEVVDEHHGRGLGTALLDAVTTVASASGIRRLQAVVAGSNRASVHLLGRVGLSFRPASGTLEADSPFHLLTPARVDRAAVVRLAFGVLGPEPGASPRSTA
ncbi:GNAT family N-acetyltransferase [Nocardioides guangzhouensis]|uniref:GNAT family N-acetyltransferase n=1 Tax=Nocardioides guangzhouensis TaxID=2497878 RepID=A0A4Q4Z6Z3_9ACTN|nr:GNAT family N-acetyltransferase [Nocardioides guangzhouensis]RYP83512.1 GNAT family N-acetyltransferase [Nocardioides guangzhouensis]